MQWCVQIRNEQILLAVSRIQKTLFWLGYFWDSGGMFFSRMSQIRHKSRTFLLRITAVIEIRQDVHRNICNPTLKKKKKKKIHGLNYNFGALPGNLFIYFCNFLSTVLIQYSSLVMGWYACCCAGFSCCCAGKNLLRYFSAPGFSWAEPREGYRAEFEPGTAVHQPDALTT